MKERVYTLEQLVQLQHAFSQRKFAEEAASLVPTTDRIHAQVVEEGLLLEGVGELDLEGAVETLTEKYGKNLVTSKLLIRYVFEPVLLEPYMKVEVTTPEDFMGMVAGDLSNRKALINEINDSGGMKRIGADVPLSEMIGYPTFLRDLTEGRGSFTINFLEYRPASSGPDGPGPRGAAAMRLA